MAERLERLRQSWRAEPDSAPLAVALAGAELRQGRRATAATVLTEARRAGAAPDEIAHAFDRLALSRWATAGGGWPARTWPGRAPRRAPELAWIHEAPRTDIRYGRPACVAGHHVGLVAQSVVVAGRFEELVALDLRDGSTAWHHEHRNVYLSSPMFALELDGRPPALGWASVAEADDDADTLCLRVDAWDAASGAHLARHEVRWPGALAVSSQRSPGLDRDGNLCWSLRVVTEQQATVHELVLDARDGHPRQAPSSTPTPPSPPGAGTWRDGAGRGYTVLRAAGQWRLVEHPDAADPSVWSALPERCAPGLGRASGAVTGCCMGEDLVLAASGSDGTWLWACRPSARRALWQLALPRGPFHDVPVPIPGGLLAVSGGAVLALRD